MMKVQINPQENSEVTISYCSLVQENHNTAAPQFRICLECNFLEGLSDGSPISIDEKCVHLENKSYSDSLCVA